LSALAPLIVCEAHPSTSENCRVQMPRPDFNPKP
jgi:hypothetical protein